MCMCKHAHESFAAPPISNLFCRHWTTSYQSTYREYGAILVSKFNNILTTCDIFIFVYRFPGGVHILGYKISCRGIYFQKGYIFRDRNFLKGYKLPGGVHIWVVKFQLTNFQQAYVFWGYKFPEGYIQLSLISRCIYFGTLVFSA